MPVIFLLLLLLVPPAAFAEDEDLDLLVPEITRLCPEEGTGEYREAQDLEYRLKEELKTTTSREQRRRIKREFRTNPLLYCVDPEMHRIRQDLEKCGPATLEVEAQKKRHQCEVEVYNRMDERYKKKQEQKQQEKAFWGK